MPYIYKITNQVNGKGYIGKTIDSVEERWRHHKSDANRLTIHGKAAQNRPLYSAINKYGIENFKIETIEECDISVLEDRERYWIEYYQTFKNGYNATIGGDGRPYLDYILICKVYDELKNMSKVAEVLNIGRDSVRRALLASSLYTEEELLQNGHNTLNKIVGQYDKNTGELIAVYSSLAKAEEAVPTGRHISAVCNGKRKTAGGYVWKYM